MTEIGIFFFDCVDKSTAGTKRQRLSTSEAGSNPQQSELDKKDQPPEKQLQTRASKKQKIDQSPRTGITFPKVVHYLTKFFATLLMDTMSATCR